MATYSTEATAPERRAFMLVLAGTDVVLLALDAARGASPLALLLASRVVLLVVLVGTALALGRPGVRARALVSVGGVVSAACIAGVARATGGSSGPYLAVLPVLPIVYLVCVPDLPWATLAMGAAGGALAVWLAASGGEGTARVATTAALNVFGTAYAVTGAALHRRVRRREAATQVELARSEARRLQAERMTLLGRVVAGVAHAVNNPLSALGSDLRWLEREAAAAPAVDRAEVEEVASDARAALERLRRIVLDVSALARQGPEERRRLPLAAVLEHAARLAALRGVHVEARDLDPGLHVEAELDTLVQAVAGILIACGEGARRGAPLRLSASAEAGQVAVRIAGAPRGTLLHDDLLLVVARERVTALGGALEPDRSGAEERIVLRLPAAPGAARSP